MKTIIRKAATTLILMTMLGSTIFGQEYARMERIKTLQIEKTANKPDAVTNVVEINVTDEFNYLKIKVQGNFDAGEILVEIVDPLGEVKRDFSIKNGKVVTETGLNMKGVVIAEMERSYRNPVKGKWVVRSTSKKADGKILVYSLQIYNPKADLIELEQIERETDSHLRF